MSKCFDELLLVSLGVGKLNNDYDSISSVLTNLFEKLKKILFKLNSI